MYMKAKDIYLSPGIEFILSDYVTLWDTLQKGTADAAHSEASNLYEFAEQCLFFAVIAKYGSTSDDEREEDSGIDHGFDPDGDTSMSYMSGSHPQADRSGRENGSGSFPVGIAYLSAQEGGNAPMGEGNVGLLLRPQYFGHGYAAQALELVLKWAFEELSFHRVQAIMLDSPTKDRSFAMFAKMGFSHEGVRRRAVYSRCDSSWHDATCFAILDTDWLMRAFLRPAPKSLWDELFDRHGREREELLCWDDKKALKRNASMETVRQRGTDAEAEAEAELEMAVETEGEYTTDDSYILAQKAEKKKAPVDDRSPPLSPSLSSRSTSYQSISPAEPPKTLIYPADWSALTTRSYSPQDGDMFSESDAPSPPSSEMSHFSRDVSDPSFVISSIVPSPDNSQWDLVTWPGSSSSSDFESDINDSDNASIGLAR